MTDHRATKAGRRQILLLTLRERAVVEAELLAESDILLSEHTDTVEALVLLDFRDSLTVGVTAVAEPGGEVTEENRVNCEHIVAIWVIVVPLISNIIEIRQVFGQVAPSLALLQYVLLFVPEPLRVYLPKVLHKQRVLANALSPITEDA